MFRQLSMATRLSLAANRTASASTPLGMANPGKMLSICKYTEAKKYCEFPTPLCDTPFWLGGLIPVPCRHPGGKSSVSAVEKCCGAGIDGNLAKSLGAN